MIVFIKKKFRIKLWGIILQLSTRIHSPVVSWSSYKKYTKGFYFLPTVPPILSWKMIEQVGCFFAWNVHKRHSLKLYSQWEGNSRDMKIWNANISSKCKLLIPFSIPKQLLAIMSYNDISIVRKKCQHIQYKDLCWTDFHYR